MAVVSVGTNFRFEMKGRMMGSLCFTCSIIRSWAPNMDEVMSFLYHRDKGRTKSQGRGSEDTKTMYRSRIVAQSCSKDENIS